MHFKRPVYVKFAEQQFVPVIYKVVFPIYFWGAAYLLFSRGASLLLVGMCVVIGAFGATLAQVMPSGEHLEYRRLFRWHRIPYADVLSVKPFLQPLMGSIRFRRQVWPWGRIYFLFDDQRAKPFDLRGHSEYAEQAVSAIREGIENGSIQRGDSRAAIGRQSRIVDRSNSNPGN